MCIKVKRKETLLTPWKKLILKKLLEITSGKGSTFLVGRIETAALNT